MESLEGRLKAEAAALGFALAGVARAAPADDFDAFCRWLDAGHAGAMEHLRRHRDARRHPEAVQPAVRSVVMVGMELTTGQARGLQPPGGHPVAAFAQCPDYHEVIWRRLDRLLAWLGEAVPGSTGRTVCDSAPLLERGFARRAGLGWVGKNCMLIHPRRGSFFMLGALLTTADLAPDEPFASDHCGTCTACLDACPTAAFAAPGVLDARRCVSYLTIELKGPVPEELRPGVGGRLFGCDVCQDVCPWNRRAGGGPSPLRPRPDLEALDPRELLAMPDAEFRRRFRGTALFRTGRAALARNAAVALGNVGTPDDLPALRAALGDPDEAVRDAAAWAVCAVERRASDTGRRPSCPPLPALRERGWG